MKKIAFAFILLGLTPFVQAQEQDTEKEIRLLDEAEVKAVLEKDSAMLLRLWDRNYVVNNPDNVVVFPGKSTLDRPVLRRSRVSFTREVEQVVVKGNVALSMGNETVVPLSDDNVKGQPIKRRYTNIWIREDGTWKLVARHANVICQNK